MKKIFTLALTLFAMTGMAYAQDIVTTVTLTNGTTLEYETNNLENITFGETPWESLGYCLYGEDIVASAIYPASGQPGDFCCQYYVEVQENTEQPGLYRLVNPYEPDVYPFYDMVGSDYDFGKNTYIEINATDPEGVFINEQETGLLNIYYGIIGIGSYASYYMDRGYTLDQVKAAGYCGTLKDGKITFPTSMLRFNLSVYSYYGTYYANVRDNFLLDLNDRSSSSGPKSVKSNKNVNIDQQGLAIEPNNQLTIK